MSAAKKLVDMATLSCSPATQTALAKRVQVSTATISQWKKGVVPFPAERIAEFARIAHMDPAEWVVLVEAEQTKGEARKAYGSLVKRLGIAALVALASVPAMASNFAVKPDVSIMLRRWMRRRCGIPTLA